MFVQLKTLLAQCKSISLLMTSEGDAVTLTVIPKLKDGQDAALSQPLQLTGTAEELDEGLAEALGKFTSARTSLLEQAEATAAILEQSRKASADKAVKGNKPTATRPAASKPKAPPSGGDGDAGGDDDDDTVAGGDAGSGVEAGSPASTATVVAPPVAATAANIFSDE